jgi:23S rRNA (uracil1939-C5)-methyltransferase
VTDQPTSAQSEFELDITTMAHGGAAIGRHQGRTIFVPYAIPGERVLVRIVQDRGRFANAKVISVVQAAPSRVSPRCPNFGPGLCGGCQLQHIDYPAQLDLKHGIVIDQMKRIGGFQDLAVHPVIPSPEPWRYRSNLTLHATEDGELGFVTTDDQHIIPIEECHIIRPELEELLDVLTLDDISTLDRVRMQVGSDSSQRVIGLTTHDGDIPQIEVESPVSVVMLTDNGPFLLIGSEVLTYTVHGHEFQVRAGGFFQVNLPQAERLVTLVMERLALTGKERVLDLYSGVGLFTVFIAEQAAAVTAVEGYLPSVEDAEINLKGAEHVEMIVGPVEEVLPRLDAEFDAVVLDPPRAGMDADALDALAALAPHKIVYVSCDLATFARDAKRLVSKGYLLHDLQPIDMFPQTASIELVAVFTRA